MNKQKHFRRIPDYINQELRRIQSQHVKVATIINIPMTDIARGAFRHLGIRVVNGHLECPQTVYPEMMSGIYARRNRNGIVWKLKDLPKVTKTFSFDSPNFGDPFKGYHTTFIEREVYQRRFEPPRDWEILLTILHQNQERVTIKAEIQTILDIQRPDFNKDLFFAINLLQEQCRNCHVFDASVTDEELTRITTVGWEIFPPGTMDRFVSTIIRGLHNPSSQRQSEILQRINVIDNLRPTGYIHGKGMNSHYFGAQFGDNIVAFENADYGNAIYILFDNWREISQMSRIDILKRHEKDYIRIIHKKGWEKALMRNFDELRKRS